MRQRSKQVRRRSGDFERRDPLGRVFSVRRESWRLDDDPRTTRPQVEVLASRRTAAEAADVAREAAAGFGRHGFHKPSGAWWAAEAGMFHRFRVENQRRAPGLLFALVSAATGIALLSALRRRPEES
jgi:hypothetical protein